MKKKLSINAGMALLLDHQSDVLSEFDSISVNAGKLIASRKVYDKLLEVGASINSGSASILDISGKVVELESNTVITSAMAYDGCFIICFGNLIIEDAKGLEAIDGLYANTVFHPDSVQLHTIKGITATRKAYPAGATLHMNSIALGADSYITLESGIHFVNGSITALDGGSLSALREKNASFQCEKLIIYAGLYDKYGDIFKAEKYIFVPDGHTFVEDITLDAATSILHGEKLFVYGDMMIPHDQAQHLSKFTALVVKGTVTMPVVAAANFKACGKAEDYDLYEGVLMVVNGHDQIGHDQLQTAIEMGLTYTINVNGKLTFLSDVTPQDIAAVAAVHCNGVLCAPISVRGVLSTKIKEMNGKLVNLESPEDDTEDSTNCVSINTGLYRL